MTVARSSRGSPTSLALYQTTSADATSSSGHRRDECPVTLARWRIRCYESRPHFRTGSLWSFKPGIDKVQTSQRPGSFFSGCGRSKRPTVYTFGPARPWSWSTRACASSCPSSGSWRPRGARSRRSSHGCWWRSGDASILESKSRTMGPGDQGAVSLEGGMLRSG